MAVYVENLLEKERGFFSSMPVIIEEGKIKKNKEIINNLSTIVKNKIEISLQELENEKKNLNEILLK